LAEVRQDERTANTGSCRFGCRGIPAIVGDDEHAIGNEGHLVFGGSMKFAIHHIKNELELSEVTAHRFLEDELGDPAGEPIADF
jgi:hypothetical protein